MGREILRNVSLVSGGVVIVASMAYTGLHFTDYVVFTVLLPGVIVGLMLIGVYAGLGGNRRWPGW